MQAYSSDKHHHFVKKCHSLFILHSSYGGYKEDFVIRLIPHKYLSFSVYNTCFVSVGEEM